jgi:hypothetical protein
MSYLNNASKDWTIRAGTIETRTGDGIVRIGQSYFQVPVGTSNERPPVASSGFIRFSTTDNVLEYYNEATSSWVAISAPPQISAVSPYYVADVCYNPAETDASINITGINFGTLPPSVTFIGSDNTTTYNGSVTNIVAGFEVNATVPQGVFDTSNLSPYAVKLTNVTSGLNTTFENAIAVNDLPFFTTDSALGTYVQGFPISGNLQPLAGSDPEGLPITFSSTDLSSGTSSSMDVAANGSFIGTFPTGSTQTVSFQGVVTDSSNAFSTKQFFFTVLENYTFSQTGGTLRYLDTISGEGSAISGTPSYAVNPLASAVITWNGAGSFTPTNLDIPIEYLVVAGGGGGGSSAWGTGGASGGGGGGGEVAYGYMDASAGITYNITVGTGGAGGVNNSSSEASNGGNSSFGSYTVLGGGFGGTSNGGVGTGNSGGCGGGGAFNGSFTKQGGNNIGSYFGQGGGNSFNDSTSVFGSGGGGGAFEQGFPATLTVGGAGGDGLNIAISGEFLHFGSGGGGGAFDSGGNPAGGSGGADSGGNGGTGATSGVGSPGIDGLGGGGGGGSYTGAHQNGGAGGDGTVMIRFPYYRQIPLENLNTVTVATTNGYYTIAFTDSTNNFVNYPQFDGYTVYTFRADAGFTNGSFVVTAAADISDVSWLVIAGGGSGGGGTSDQVGSGGGGAGGYRLGVDPADTNLSSDQSGGPSTAENAIKLIGSEATTLTVGVGGQGPSGNVQGNDGNNSSISSASISITSTGGGGGGDSGGSAQNGRNGGSGGGVGAYASAAGTGIAGQGNNGAKTTTTSIAGGGGGGGAGAAGASGTGGAGNPAGIGGDGGDGLGSLIQGGVVVYRGGGGGGGSYITTATRARGGQGGLGGGGYGCTTFAATAQNGLQGINGTGGGGGGVSLGATNTSAANGGNGGSGIIILRFKSFSTV